MYVSFMDLQKAYDRVNREAVWQVLRMYDVGGKLLNGIKSMYINSLAYVRVKGGESECSRINSDVTRVYHVPLGLQCTYGRSDEGGKNWEGSEIRGGGKSGGCRQSCMKRTWFYVASRRKTLGRLGRLLEVFRRGLKVNAGKSKVIVLGREEGLECLV